MLFPAIDWCMISIHHWIVMSVQSLGVHLSTVLIVTVPSLFVARCSPFHCPYRHCTFRVCCSVFTFPLSLLSLYLHCLLLGVHLSTVLIVTVPSLFVARCSPFHCPYYCTFTVCLLLNVHLSTVLISHCTFTVFLLPSFFTFPLSLSSLYLHCLLSSAHLSTVLFTVPSLFVVQCTPFHRPQQSLYLHCLLSSVHLSTVLITVSSLSLVQCSPFHCPHHCTFTVCCPVFTFPPSSAVTVPSVFVRCPVDSSCAVKLHPVLHCSS